MSKHILAIYEGGVFHPLEPVQLPERQEVTVNIPEIPPLKTEEDLHPENDWAEVVLPGPGRKPLFSKTFDVSPGALPRREPQVTIEPQWLEPGDE